MSNQDHTESTETHLDETKGVRTVDTLDDVEPIGSEEGTHETSTPEASIGELPIEDEQEEPDESTKGGREAAKYRRRLREAEAERDALTEQVTTLRRAAAERIAGTDGGLPNPGALWVGEAAVDDMLDDDGNVDRDKVLAAAAGVAREYGIARTPRTPRPNPAQREAEGIARPTGTQGMVDALRAKPRF